MKIILEKDDWYNIALISQNKANKKYFVLFEAIKKILNLEPKEPTEPTSNSGFLIYCVNSGKIIVLS